MSKLTKEEFENYVDIRDSIDKKLAKALVAYSAATGDYDIDLLDGSLNECVFVLSVDDIDKISFAVETWGDGLNVWEIPVDFLFDRKSCLARIKEERERERAKLSETRKRVVENEFILEHINSLDELKKEALKIILERKPELLLEAMSTSPELMKLLDKE